METISAQKAWSLFTIIALLILLIGLSNVLMIWELLFPVYTGGKVQKRQVSPLYNIFLASISPVLF